MNPLDILFIHTDGTTQSFPAECSIAANLYAIIHAHKIRAAHWNGEKAVFKNGVPIALIECSREQLMEQI